MNGLETGIRLAINELLSDIGSDFCTLGLLDPDNRILKWKWAAGNLSERFQDMEDRPGRGFQQSVIKIGRAMTLHVSDLIASRQLHEYPLLLSEKLRSAYAAPLYDDMRVTGVLLIGDRVKRIYRPDDRQRVSSAAEQIAAQLKMATGNIHPL